MKNSFLPKIPYGTKDFLTDSAVLKRVMERNVAELFVRWGYEEIVTPTFEYMEIFDNSSLNDQAFKFFDRDGNAMVLRPDMTAPIARVASTRLRDKDMPKKISYVANVFRYEKAQAGRQCEFYQAGVELLGVCDPSADAEILALAVEAIKTAGLDEFTVSIGHVEFLGGIVESTALSSDEQDEVKAFLSGRDLAGLEAYLDEKKVDKNICEALKEVVFLHGKKEVLEKAQSLTNNEKSKKALDNLQQIYIKLEKYGAADKIKFDLALIRDFGYYTGMVFEGYTYGMGFPICGGGRYDNMMSVFGSPAPAIGFSIGIDRLLLLLNKQGKYESGTDTVYIAWGEGFYDKAVETALKMRSEGKNAEVAFYAMTKTAVEELAGSRKVLYVGN